MGLSSEKVGDWDRLAKEADFRPGKFAELFGVSRRQLQRLTQRDFGKTPTQWLRGRKLKNALEIVKLTESVRDAATHFGYKQSGNFIRDFKKVHGFNPGAILAGREERVTGAPSRVYRNIYRKTARPQGFLVIIFCERRRLSTFFADQNYGGRTEAYEAARAHRDKLLMHLKSEQMQPG